MTVIRSNFPQTLANGGIAAVVPDKDRLVNLMNLEPIPKEEVQNSPYTFHGEDAIKEVEKLEGTLTPAQKRVIELEGFVSRPYYDTKGIVTYGVGQTGDFIKPGGFKEAFNTHVDRVRKKVPIFDKLPEEVQTELIQTDYRGDVGADHKWVDHLNNKRFYKAGEEFLNHTEYKGLKEAGIENSITKRLESLSNALKLLDAPKPKRKPLTTPVV